MPQTSASGGPGSSAANAAAGSDAPASAVTAAGSGAGDSAVAGSRSPVASSPVVGSPMVGSAVAAPTAPAQRPDRTGGLGMFPALLTAIVGGLALAGAFPPVGFWPLAAVGPALLVIALWNRGPGASFVVGLVFGLAFFIPLLSWLINLAWYAWAALAVAEAVIFAPAGHRPAADAAAARRGHWRSRPGGSRPRRSAPGGRTRSRGAGWR